MMLKPDAIATVDFFAAIPLSLASAFENQSEIYFLIFAKNLSGRMGAIAISAISDIRSAIDRYNQTPNKT
ncbi:MAG: hypothetical protein F6K28_36385 [Microcoleus sp. SIO2G3]|nr:hypothetical protein [Microcoleus sp. SIO2G3]